MNRYNKTLLQENQSRVLVLKAILYIDGVLLEDALNHPEAVQFLLFLFRTRLVF